MPATICGCWSADSGWAIRHAKTLLSDRVARVEVVELAASSDRLACAWVGAAFVRAVRRAAVGRHSRRRLPAARRSARASLLDVILIDVDHSPDERLGDESISFYTTQGLLAARRHLAADGVLAVWSYAESSPFADALRDVFAARPRRAGHL